MAGLQSLATNVLTRPGTLRRMRPLLRGSACVFMLHRIADPALGIEGKRPEAIRGALELMRREGFRFVSLPELFEGLARGDAPGDAIAFTMDDGTEEQLRLAGPVFAEYGCPATLFLVTDYLDGRQWFWWHRVEHVMEETSHTTVDFDLGWERTRLTLGDRASRRRAADTFAMCLKRGPEERKEALIEALARSLDVVIPDKPPARYAPTTWDEVRRWEKAGLRFAPHSRTHRILSKLDATECRHEIAGSWARLREELGSPVPAFAYPNGQAADFGQREQEILAELGFVGAFAGRVAYAEAGPVGAHRLGRYGVPRLDFPEEPRRLAAILSGLRRWRDGARDGVRRVLGR